jgi:hypothetical protein
MGAATLCSGICFSSCALLLCSRLGSTLCEYWAPVAPPFCNSAAAALPLAVAGWWQLWLCWAGCTGVGCAFDWWWLTKHSFLLQDCAALQWRRYATHIIYLRSVLQQRRQGPTAQLFEAWRSGELHACTCLCVACSAALFAHVGTKCVLVVPHVHSPWNGAILVLSCVSYQALGCVAAKA